MAGAARLISIVTVTFNAAAHLRHCLASLSSQTVPFEHIIVDGASTDRTLDIIEGYRAPQASSTASTASICLKYWSA